MKAEEEAPKYERPVVSDQCLMDPDILDQIGTGFVTSDENAVIIRVNRTFADMVGYTVEELRGSSIGTISYPEDLRLEHDLIDRALTHRLSEFRFKKRYVHRKGKLVPTLVTITILAGNQKKEIPRESYVALVEDLRHSKWMDSQIGSIRSALDIAGIGIAFSDLDGNLTYVNSHFLDIWGYIGDGEVLGKKVTDLWVDPGKAQSNLEEVLEKGSSEGVLDAYSESGGRVPIKFKAWQIRDPLDRAIALCGTFEASISKASEVEPISSQETTRILPPRLDEKIFNAMSELVALMSPDLDILWANRAARKYAGKRKVLGCKCYEVWNNRENPCPHCPVHLTLKEGIEQIKEVGTQDGKYWNIRTIPLFDADGKLEYILEITHDITEEKQNYSELMARERELYFISEFAADWVYWLSSDGRFRYVSPSVERITGYPRQSFIDNPGFLRTIILDEDRHFMDRHTDEFHLGQRREEQGKIDFRIRHKDGSIRWIQHYCAPVFSTELGYQGRRTTNRDITLEQDSQIEKHHTLTKLAALLTNSNEGILLENRKRRIEQVNPRFREIFSIPGELDLTGMDCREAATACASLFSDPQEFTEKIESIVKNDEPVYGEVFALKDGRYLQRDFIPVGTGDTRQNYFWIYRDITDQKQTEEKLRNTLKEKDFLMRELNHRVKNNLLMISSLVHLKSADLGESADLTDLEHRIDAIRIVHENLNQSGSTDRIEMRDYVRAILGTIFSAFTTRRVRQEYDIAPLSLDVGTAIPLGLIINEIATNALKHGFTSLDEAVFSVALGPSDIESQYLMTLSNTGHPFPEELDLTTPHTLGLQLITTLVKQIDGNINLTRKPFPVFNISFPHSDPGPR